ncbi:hypothetical protein [Rhodocyclus gracilis]|uniref:Uncharacterized protein n=1 Tax=Rhodocyclus tenuis TaxID=1066 RepID=A0A6L5JUB1_RHOTE|nr:hypothetical protein [Rhodocyclus gracilis]MQY50963.1 hypothetical protein [Rhodocyclus gracilis]
MATVLSLDQAPPLAAPMRFFLTAPIFAMAAGVLLVVHGSDFFASRWMPATLAVTHLLTLGFMLQVMLGALCQLLPVVAGAQMERPLSVAGWVHAAISAGTVLLVAAFWLSAPVAFGAAASLLSVGILGFVAAAVVALRDEGNASATVRDMRLALLGLTVTLIFGALLAAGLAGALSLPLPALADIHLSWGFVAWGGVLLAGVALVVVPMFQLTPSYPRWFERGFSRAAFAFVLAWTVFDLAGWRHAAAVFAVAAAVAGAVLAAVTLWVQSRSKRARFDATQQCWRVAMLCALLACALWLLRQALMWLPPLDVLKVPAADWLAGQGGAVLFGGLIIVGGFLSAMTGMLYKIVPFLVWLHARNAARRGPAPNMRQVLGEPAMLRQARCHFAACLLLVLASVWPEVFARICGAVFALAQGLLLANLLRAACVYRAYLRQEPLGPEPATPPVAGQSVAV